MNKWIYIVVGVVVAAVVVFVVTSLTPKKVVVPRDDEEIYTPGGGLATGGGDAGHATAGDWILALAESGAITSIISGISSLFGNGKKDKPESTSPTIAVNEDSNTANFA